MLRRKKILFIIGSPNQTSQMHQIATRLPEYDAYFSQVYSKNPLIGKAVRSGLLDNTALSGEFRRMADTYLMQHHLRNDYAQSIYCNEYDLVVLCSDLLVTRELRKNKTIWVQEGMTDPIRPWGRWTRRLGLPSYFALNTAFNGCSNICDIYCAASEGYRQQFSRWGTDLSRIVVTGIPNYDHAAVFRNNDFPLHGYVLVATSDVRETFRKDDRPAFIRKCVALAAGRQLVFKLHPNEQKERAIREIRAYAPPETLIYTDGKVEPMIANCEELITQYSTVVYTGIALGKKVHSYFDISKLKALAPIQNEGQSAMRIADICRRYIEFPGSGEEFTRTLNFAKNWHEQSEGRYHHSNQERFYPSAG
jgi:hypothetical protein